MRARNRSSPTALQVLREHLDLLKNCQMDGIEAAFTRHLQAAPSLVSSSVKLHSIFEKLDRKQRPGDLPERIELFQSALELVDREEHPEIWAQLEGDLANSLMENPQGLREQNIEQALWHYQKILEVFTRQDYPEEWAMTHDHLAVAYEQRRAGNRSDNIQAAMKHFKLALQVSTFERDPEGWAAIQNNMANVWLYRDVEKAIHHFQLALKVYTRDHYPEDWAMAHNNLGTAYWSRKAGDQAQNIEKAIEHYLRAMEVADKPMTGRWAQLHFNLGDAYRDRVQGDRSQNIEQAIDHYKQALQVYTRRNSAKMWAMMHYNLGDCYSDRRMGVRIANVETAIRHYQRALEVYQAPDFQMEAASTHNNLGVIYLDRVKGEPAENLELAIHHFDQALEPYGQPGYAQDWAVTLNNLGNAHLRRVYGERGENLANALHYYQQALEIFEPEHSPEQWAMAHNNLANVYQQLGGLENRIKARQHYEQALEVYTLEAFPQDWAMVNHNLAGITYSENAIVYAQRALQVRTKEAQPFQWAATHLNLAGLFQNRPQGSRMENIQQAVRHYESALEVYDRFMFPAENRMALQALGDLFFEECKWGQATGRYQDAIQTSEDLIGAAFTEAGLQLEIGKTVQIYLRTAYCLARLNRPDKAFLTLEQGKARLLREALAWSDPDFKRLPVKLRDRLKTARKRVENLRAQMRDRMLTSTKPTGIELAQQAQEAYAELRRLLDAIQAADPQSVPGDLDFEQFMAQIPENTAYVAPWITSQGGAVFVIPHGCQRIDSRNILWLEEFSEQTLKGLLTGSRVSPGWLTAYQQYRREIQAAQGLDAEQRQSAVRQALEGWQTAMDSLTSKLWEQFMGPIHQKLADWELERVILLPQGGLQLLPLHASWRWEGESRRYFRDDFKVVYAPSAFSLQVCARRASRPVSDKALVVGIDDYRELPPLQNACSEAAAIAALLGVQPRLDSAASLEAVLSAAEGCSTLHLACHGSFAWDTSPFASALYLAQDEALTLARILSGELSLEAARIVTLSACETGFTEIADLPDEFIGLPAGFLQAGASAVVSSLWSVDDYSTAILMGKFYEYLLEGQQPPSEALAAAQKWLSAANRVELGGYFRSPRLRQLPGSLQAYSQIMSEGDPHDIPYAHPYYWAAFTFTGA